jgi:hypothetical protein
MATKKSNGYWTKKQTVRDARLFVNEHGSERLSSLWMRKNGYSGLAGAIHRHGGFLAIRAELGLETGQKQRPSGYWTDGQTEADALDYLAQYGELAFHSAGMRSRNRNDLRGAISKHGGFTAWKKRLGIQAKTCASSGRYNYWTPERIEKESKAFIEANGKGSFSYISLMQVGRGDLAGAVNRCEGFRAWRKRLRVESPCSGKGSNLKGGDSMRLLLSGEQRFASEKDCTLYVVELANHPGHSKPGIAFDLKARSRIANGQYGSEALQLLFGSRAEAFILEQAVLDQTRGFADCPDDLINQGWAGASEVRAMPAEDMVPIVLRLADELEEMGVWSFAAAYVPMTAAQRMQCQQRAHGMEPVEMEDQ